MVDDEFLEVLTLEKGTRKVVNHEERGRVLRAMDGCSYKAAAGGSLSNSLVALARLGTIPGGGPFLNVAMAGSVGSDPLGSFYRLASVSLKTWVFEVALTSVHIVFAHIVVLLSFHLKMYIICFLLFLFVFLSHPTLRRFQRVHCSLKSKF